MNKRVLIIAGEVSGDRHAADLIRELRHLRPDFQFLGIGGDRMREEGVELLFHVSQMAMVGFTEIVRHLPFIRRVRKTIDGILRKGVSAVILVDYPGFNLQIARMAAKRGLPVIYYISPQLWAWGEGRVEKMRRYVNLLLVIFEFERQFYRKHGIEAHFVGHPLVDQIHVDQSEEEFRRAHKLPADRPILGLFPGSREMEVRKLLPVMANVARQAVARHGCLPVIAAADQLPPSVYESCLQGRGGIPILRSQTHPLMKYSRAAMVASGTATLELGYLQTPMVVLYSVSPLSYTIGRRLIRIDTIAMANIVLQKKVVPEFIQKQVTVKEVGNAVDKLLGDEGYHQSIKQELARIPLILGEAGASARAARRVVEFLGTGLPE